jgi:hypothetical protein
LVRREVVLSQLSTPLVIRDAFSITLSPLCPALTGRRVARIELPTMRFGI